MNELNNQSKENLTTDKAHPWRMCGIGEHWVRTHPMHVPPSKTHPDGYITTRRGHCAKNPSGHNDQLHLDEIQEIAEQNFKNVEPKPCSLSLGYPLFKKEYDDLIAGWTKYWNDIFHLDEPLDVNLVKALMASESSFDARVIVKKKNPKKTAYGLLQVLEESREIMGNQKGELKKNYIMISSKDLLDPNINICSGIRWLFHKQYLLSHRLKRSATWAETIFEYKGGRTTTPENMKKIMQKFSDKYTKLQKCEKE